MSKKKTQTHGAGRPAGSKTTVPVLVRAKRAQCPACGSTEHLKRGRELRDVPFEAKHADGSVTTRRRWVRARCQCGQAATIIEDYRPAAALKI
jgi:hypothetical protein